METLNWLKLYSYFNELRTMVQSVLNGPIPSLGTYLYVI